MKKTDKSRYLTRLIACLMALLCLWSMTPFNTIAASYRGSTVISNNIHEHVYSTTSKVANSYMCVNPDGTISRIENFGDVILNEKYNSKYKLASQGTLPFELTKFGGFYSGASYNYLVFGQDNPNHDNNLEVIRVVKYDKNWRKVGVISIKNCNTAIPFYMSNTSFAEYGNYLFLRCGHLAYEGQQGSMTFEINTSNNTVVASTIYPTPNNGGSVENSGASYIDVTGGVLTVAEKSLTNPSSLLMTRYSGGVGGGTFSSGTSSFACLGQTDKLSGTIPEFSLGGYASNASYSFAVCNSMPMDGTSPNKDLVLVAVPRSTFSKSTTSISYLTGYAQGDPMTVETPYIVKVNENLFAILWEQRNGYSDMCHVYYTFIDGTGRRLMDANSIEGCLSDCQPVVYGNNITWYTTNGASVNLYTIPISVNNSSNVYAPQNATAGKTDYSKVFDYNYYMNRYPDMRVLYSNNEAGALNHFINTGMAEGRQGSSDFNVYTYAKNYPDLQAVFGSNLKAYYLHYINSGFAEGRNARTNIK